MSKETQKEKQCPKRELKRFSANDLTDAFFDGKCIVVLVNNDGGPRCSDWRSPKLKELELLGVKLRAAIPSRVLLASFGDYADSDDVFRLVEGIHVEEGHPNGIVGYTKIEWLGARSQYYQVAGTTARHEVSEEFVKRFNDRVSFAIRNGDKDFYVATGMMDDYVPEASLYEGSHILLSRDVVIMSYLAACRGAADFSLDEWPRYLDSVAICYDRVSKTVTDVGLLPRSAVESVLG